MTSNNFDNNNIDYMNSRPLDVHTWSDYSEVNDFVDDIYQLLKSIKGPYTNTNTIYIPFVRFTPHFFIWV